MVALVPAPGDGRGGADRGRRGDRRPGAHRSAAGAGEEEPALRAALPGPGAQARARPGRPRRRDGPGGLGDGARHPARHAHHRSRDRAPRRAAAEGADPGEAASDDRPGGRARPPQRVDARRGPAATPRSRGSSAGRDRASAAYRTAPRSRRRRSRSSSASRGTSSRATWWCRARPAPGRPGSAAGWWPSWSPPGSASGSWPEPQGHQQPRRARCSPRPTSAGSACAWRARTPRRRPTAPTRATTGWTTSRTSRRVSMATTG